MNKMQEQVRDFMRAFQQSCPEKPLRIIPDSLLVLRNDLIKEEQLELQEAVFTSERADAIGDLLYVVFGAAVAYGIDIEPIFEEIHRSNMTKLWTGEEVTKIPLGAKAVCVKHGSLSERTILVKRADGKVIKSPSYSPANLQPIIDKQTI